MDATHKRMLARTTPAGLAWVASHGMWMPGPHLMLLSKKLVACATGRCPRLMVFMPPRHGKSELISKYTPAWFVGNFPEKKVMLASYEGNFAASWGRKARDVVEEWGPSIFDITVKQDSKSGAHWELDKHQGVMVTAGVGGAITGKGADVLIIDDPVKNAEDAHSETMREKHWEWWLSTARTRLMPGAAVILVMTRWHEDDLAGRLLKAQDEGGDQWEVINFPAFAEPILTSEGVQPDALGRSEGEPLWPAMWTTEALDQTRKALGSYWWNALYQQRPAPLEGGLFKKADFRYFEPPVDGDKICIVHTDNGPLAMDLAYCTQFATMDVANSEKEKADYTVYAHWAVTPQRDLLLLHVERVKLEGPDLPNLVRRMYYEWHPSYIGIERLGYGSTLVQHMLRDGLPIIKLEPDVDKVTRALPAAARYQEHRVYHRRGAEWLSDWEAELLGFPNMAHDDQVDTVAYAALQLPSVAPAAMRGWEQKSRGNTITGGFIQDVM